MKRESTGGAVVVEAGDGWRIGNVEFLARSDDTPRFNLALITIEAGRAGPPPHRHRDEDDSFFVLEGELTFTVEGREIEARAGTFVLVPPGHEHAFENRDSTPARILNVHAPAGFDRRLSEP